MCQREGGTVPKKYVGGRRKPVVAHLRPSANPWVTAHHQEGNRSLWAVMKAYPWSDIKVEGVLLQGPPEGPHRLVPLFRSRELAVAWAGSDEHVVELILGTTESVRPK